MDVMQGKEIPSATSDISEIQEWMQAYPISDILSSRGSTATAYFHQNEAYMKAVGDFYKEENLERLKNYHMVSFLKNYDRYCDEETIVPDIYAFEQMPTLADNAKSLPMINAFMFSIGITKSSGYSSDMSMEEMYGIIGYVLAHEMSHCFDENGSKIDKDGKMNDWWTPEDKEKFEARLQKLIDYYDNITLFEGVNVQGKVISAEATTAIPWII